jgi:DNA methylase
VIVEQAYRDELVSLYRGDALQVLRALPAAGVDALVTDPPAGIAFMGREWDTFSVGRRAREAFVDWLTDVMAECRRLLRPGAHALVWAIPRTSHWTATAIEDAGFEVRDVVHHLFAQGFPKSRDVGEGRGTGLKPAAEHWILARKPLAEPSVAANLLAHNVGALHIDACRIPSGADHALKCLSVVGLDSRRHASVYNGHQAPRTNAHRELGRWPANLVLTHAEGCRPAGTRWVTSGTAVRHRGVAGGQVYSRGRWAHLPGTADMGYAGADGLELVQAWACVEGCPVAELDRQSGDSVSRQGGARAGAHGEGWRMTASGAEHTDAGGASRFFFVAKASSADRSAGLAGERNRHPTVKSVELMRWLLRLVTPPGGLVLDCFAGSGSTLVAAKLEGLRSIGIERDPEAVDVCVRRLAWAVHQPSLLEAEGRPEPAGGGSAAS